MKKDYTDITLILDRSGSMAKLRNDVIGGVNTFIEDQRNVSGHATVTLVQFDELYQIDYEAIDIKDVKPLDYSTYSPRGKTALLDAIGKTIVTTGERLRNMKEEDRPDKVIMVIQTDGDENASVEYTTVAEIKAMIEVQQNEFSWEVVFMGANIDAVSTGNLLGIKAGNAMTFGANSQGTQSAFRSVSTNMASYRCGTKADMSYTSVDVQAQHNAGVQS